MATAKKPAAKKAAPKKAANPKGAGRKASPDGRRFPITITAKVNEAQRKAYHAKGSSGWLRGLLDNAIKAAKAK